MNSDNQKDKIKMLRHNLRRLSETLHATNPQRVLDSYKSLGHAIPKRRRIDQPITLLVGTHRSGTSFMAKILSVTGQDLGRSLMQPSFDNPTGFWENQRIVAVHDDLIKSSGKDWTTATLMPKNWVDSPNTQKAVDALVDILKTDFSPNKPWLIKDPRLCILFPLWTQVAEKLKRPLKKIFTIRSPEATAYSLQARNGLSLEFSRWITLSYLSAAAQHFDDDQKVFVYENLIELDGYNLLLEFAETSGNFRDLKNFNLVNQVDQIVNVDRRRKSYKSEVHDQYMNMTENNSAPLNVMAVKSYLTNCLNIPEISKSGVDASNASTLLPPNSQNVSVPRDLYDKMLAENHEAEKLQTRIFDLEKYISSHLSEKDQLKVLSKDSLETHQATSNITHKLGRAAIILSSTSETLASRATSFYDLISDQYDVEIISLAMKDQGQKDPIPSTFSARKTTEIRSAHWSEFYAQSTFLAQDTPFDMVIVVQPELPGIVLSGMIKKHSQCPIVIDIVDFSIADPEDIMKPPGTETTRHNFKVAKNALRKAIKKPFGKDATLLAAEFVDSFDGISVSNTVLQRRFGGAIIRHSRDETIFNPEAYERHISREKMGLQEDDFCILCLGDGAKTNGLRHIADTLETMNDERFALVVLGELESEDLKSHIQGLERARIKIVPKTRTQNSPNYLAGADAIVALLDDETPASHFKVPLEITDGLSFGLPVITAELEPIYDLESLDLITVIHPDYLSDTLLEIYDAHNSENFSRDKIRRRMGFEMEMGYSVNRVRLNSLLNSARSHTYELPAAFNNILGAIRDEYINTSKPKFVKPTQKTEASQLNLVMFFPDIVSIHQYDRPQKFAEELISNDIFDKILQFYPPKEFGLFHDEIRKNSRSPKQAKRELDLKLGLADRNGIYCRRFLWRERHKVSELIDGTNIDVYAAYIREQMDLLGLSLENTYAWLSLPNINYRPILRQVPFAGVISDISDSTFSLLDANNELPPSDKTALQEILGQSDHIIASRHINSEIETEFFPEKLEAQSAIVPSGISNINAVEKPEPIRSIKSPIAGFVGKSFNNIDWALLMESAYHIPDIQFIIASSGALDETIAKDLRENIFVIENVRPYEFDAYMANFDICLVPFTTGSHHADLSNIQQFIATHKPVIATEIENLEKDLADELTMIRNAGELALTVQSRLADPEVDEKRRQNVIDSRSWEARGRLLADSIRKAFTLPSP